MQGSKNGFSLEFSPTKVLYLIEILLEVNKAYFSRNMISTNEGTQNQKYELDSFVYQTWNQKKCFSSEHTLTCLELSVEALTDDIKTKATEKNEFDYRT